MIVVARGGAVDDGSLESGVSAACLPDCDEEVGLDS